MKLSEAFEGKIAERFKRPIKYVPHSIYAIVDGRVMPGWFLAERNKQAEKTDGERKESGD